MSEREVTLTVSFTGEDDEIISEGPCGGYTKPSLGSVSGLIASAAPDFPGVEDAFDIEGNEALAEAPAEEAEPRLSIRLVTDGVSSGASSVTGAGVSGQLSQELTVNFDWGSLESCCAQYVRDLRWIPRPLQYPDFDPPRLAYEPTVTVSSGDEGDDGDEDNIDVVPLDLDDDDYPILYFLEDEGSLHFAYLPCGFKVSVPHSAANRWLKAKIGSLSQDLYAYSYQLLWEPPIKEHAPDSLFVRGPLVSGGTPDPHRPGKNSKEPTTLPLVFYARIDGDDYKLKTLELRPQQTEHCGYIHFHDLTPYSQIAECEYQAAMSLYDKKMSAWRDAVEQWRAQPEDTRGDYPEPPERPGRIEQPEEQDSLFNDYFELSGSTQVESDDESDTASLYDLLDQHRDEDGTLPDALIYAVAERTYGRWNFELAGRCPDCHGQQVSSIDDCDTEIVIAEQAAFFNRSKPGVFTPSYIGDTNTYPVAVLRNAHSRAYMPTGIGSDFIRSTHGWVYGKSERYGGSVAFSASSQWSVSAASVIPEGPYGYVDQDGWCATGVDPIPVPHSDLEASRTFIATRRGTITVSATASPVSYQYITRPGCMDGSVNESSDVSLFSFSPGVLIFIQLGALYPREHRDYYETHPIFGAMFDSSSHTFIDTYGGGGISDSVEPFSLIRGAEHTIYVWSTNANISVNFTFTPDDDDDDDGADPC